MTRKKWLVAAAVTGVASTAGTGIAIASSGSGLDGPTRERVERAALEHVGGRTVLESERGDEGEAYEVEVRLPDGTVVEVHLAADLSVMSQSPGDGDTGGNTGGDTEGDDDGERGDR